MGGLIPYRGGLLPSNAPRALFGNETPRGAVIFLATAWGPAHGGINSFNSDLALACGKLGRVPVLCVVPQASPSAVADAQAGKVHLLLAPLDDLDAIWSQVAATASPTMRDRFVWVGHDVHTGLQAVRCAERFNGRHAVIHHMDYASYATMRRGALEAEEKRQAQQHLLTRAATVFSVGPVLGESARALSGREPIVLAPGLAEIAPQTRDTGHMQVLMVGRLGLDDDGVKQARLAVEAVARASERPEVQHWDWRLRLIGAAEGEGWRADDALYRSIWQAHLTGFRPLDVLPFDRDRSRLFRELAGADLVLMPSLREGFGLIGWEAIAAGTPLIASAWSGLYRHLGSLGERGAIKAIRLQGQGVEDGRVDPRDTAALVESIVSVAMNRGDEKKQALRLRATLRARPDCSWDATAATLLDAFDVPRGFHEIALGLRARLTDRQPIRSRLSIPLDLPDPVGRTAEIGKLTRQWVDREAAGGPPLAVSVVVAPPGFGKSRVIAAAVRDIVAQDPPDATLAWAFPEQAGEGGGSQSNVLLDWILASLGRLPNDPLPEREQLELAIQLLLSSRVLLVLDGLETVQFPHLHDRAGEIADPIIAELVERLASRMPGLLLLGSRQMPQRVFAGIDVATVRLKPLEPADGAELLRQRGLEGPPSQLEDYSRALKGHPMTLDLFGGFVVERAGGELRAIDRFLDALGDDPDVDRVLQTTMRQWFEHPVAPDPAALEVLRSVALFDRPADLCILSALRGERITGVTETSGDPAVFYGAVERLQGAGLLLRTTDRLDLHPIVRAWFEADLERRDLAAYQDAHARLYAIIEDMGDRELATEGRLDRLYQSLRHGVRAGLPQRVSDNTLGPKIRQHNKNRSTALLGLVTQDLESFGYFFRRRYEELAPGRTGEGLTEFAQAWILNETNSLLFALGRVPEAAPLQARVLDRMRIQSEARRDQMRPASFWGPPGSDRRDTRPQLSTSLKKLGETRSLMLRSSEGLELLTEAVDVAIEAGALTKQVEARASMAWIEFCAGSRAMAEMAIVPAHALCLTAPIDHLGREAITLAATPFIGQLLDPRSLNDLVAAAQIRQDETPLRTTAMAGLLALELALSDDPAHAPEGARALDRWFGIRFGQLLQRDVILCSDHLEHLMRQSGHLTSSVYFGFAVAAVYRKAAARCGYSRFTEVAEKRERAARDLARRFGMPLLAQYQP